MLDIASPTWTHIIERPLLRGRTEDDAFSFAFAARSDGRVAWRIAGSDGWRASGSNPTLSGAQMDVEREIRERRS